MRSARPLLVALLMAAVGLISPAAAGATAAPSTADAGINVRTVLLQWWHGGRQDNYLSGSPAGDANAERSNYVRVRIEGYGESQYMYRTIPLVLYWHQGRRDNLVAATPATHAAAQAAGYTRMWTETHVYSVRVAGTIPLDLYWHNGRGDNLTVANAAAKSAARAQGYVFVRTEGYVWPAS